MAVVQSPQDFYNTDSFTHVVNEEGRSLWEENRIFFSLLQPGRDHWNASFFCGSCGSSSAIGAGGIGGFASQTIIEDMETTMQLHAHGFNSAYHGETLAYGLAPGAADAYHVQRLRWGQGSMQILRKLKPLTMRGLTLPQRINYFAGTAAYLEGWQKAIFYLMPLFYFFTGILPVAGNERDFLLRLFPYIAIAILAFELLSRGTGYLFLSERFTMVRVWTYMMAALAIFTTKPLKFNVTPKGQSVGAADGVRAAADAAHPLDHRADLGDHRLPQALDRLHRAGLGIDGVLGERNLGALELLLRVLRRPPQPGDEPAARRSPLRGADGGDRDSGRRTGRGSCSRRSRPISIPPASVSERRGASKPERR